MFTPADIMRMLELFAPHVSLVFSTVSVSAYSKLLCFFIGGSYGKPIQNCYEICDELVLG